MGHSKPSPLAFPQRPPGPALGALSEPLAEGESMPFANPNLQYGTHDMGYGWTNVDETDAHAQGYDLSPEGIFVYTDAHF